MISKERRPTISFDYQGRHYIFRFKKGCNAGVTLRSPTYINGNNQKVFEIGKAPFPSDTLYGGYTYQELLQKIKLRDRRLGLAK